MCLTLLAVAYLYHSHATDQYRDSPNQNCFLHVCAQALAEQESFATSEQLASAQSDVQRLMKSLPVPGSAGAANTPVRKSQLFASQMIASPATHSMSTDEVTSVQRLFDALDLNKCQLLELDQLSLVYSKQKLLTNFFRDLESCSPMASHTITLDEFVGYFEDMRSKKGSRCLAVVLRHWFSQIDKQPQGDLSCRRQQLEKVFEEMDLDNSGFIDAEELSELALMRRALHQKQGDTTWTEQMNKRLLKEIDTDGDGQINQTEFVDHYDQLFRGEDDVDFDTWLAQFLQVVQELQGVKLKKQLLLANSLPTPDEQASAEMAAIVQELRVCKNELEATSRLLEQEKDRSCGEAVLGDHSMLLSLPLRTLADAVEVGGPHGDIIRACAKRRIGAGREIVTEGLEDVAQLDRLSLQVC